MKLKRSPAAVSRRRFLRRSAAAAGAVAFPVIIPGSALGLNGSVAPSERIVLGGIGIGPRGKYDLSVMLPEKDVQFVAVCDVQRSRREEIKGMVDAHYGNQDCARFRDFRDLLAREDIDAVLIATGDRWHALASLMAVKAGKDVYSEKPCGMTVREIQQLSDGIRRYGRIFQAGTQRRSQSNFRYAVEMAQTGVLGKLHTLHASVYVPSKSYLWLPEEPEPDKEECDWDLWLGPAPWRPYNNKYIQGGWRGHHDFEAGGNFLDWGAHTLDLCQWANQADHTTPLEFEATDKEIIGQYANGVKVICDFLPTAFGDRSPQYRTSTGTCPVRFEGSDGWVETGDSSEIALSENLMRERRQIFQKVGTSAASHARNFFDCVKSRKKTICNEDVMRKSHMACFAAQLAWQLGRKMTFDPVLEEFVNDDEANRMRSRATRHPWSFNI
ncbi:MAG: Gfo/Idh/MocA family oxidoreductase [Kiritimatiellae bacterium]|nr:Gfo/Idh/MocA family oxidoreductase [Kiritimatiellia bacterium]